MLKRFLARRTIGMFFTDPRSFETYLQQLSWKKAMKQTHWAAAEGVKFILLPETEYFNLLLGAGLPQSMDLRNKLHDHRKAIIEASERTRLHIRVKPN